MYLAFAATSADGETRTRTGDTTIFSRGSATGECGPFPARTRGAVAGPRARVFPRFPRDCGVFGRRFADLCLNSVAAERAHAECLTALAARRDRMQSKPPRGPLRPGELHVLTVVGRQVRAWGRVSQAVGVGHRCSGGWCVCRRRQGRRLRDCAQAARFARARPDGRPAGALRLAVGAGSRLVRHPPAPRSGARRTP